MSASLDALATGRPGARVPADSGPGRAARSLRESLRTATADAHRALEATPLMRAVADAVPDRAVYAAYLGRQWQLHAALEARLVRWLPPQCVAERLVKTAWLEQDLRALRQPMTATPADLAPITDATQALGVLYVLEGATLGLQLVMRRLPPAHPARGDAGRFMAAYGELTGLRWAAFLRSLDAVDRCDWPVACAAAVATFAAFQAVFDPSWPGAGRARGAGA